ncbi:hypothetical protein BDR26DRAFT_865461 [Obelidium mucronatum]|nr:hypothetical protein BDR26DRAFT_865461 [Obelidium mucronatum]
MRLMYNPNDPHHTSGSSSQSGWNPWSTGSPSNRHLQEQQPDYVESWFGFCRERIDAQILIEAVISGKINPICDLPPGCSAPNVRSGSVIVFQEGATQTLRVRWRDSKQWSSSKVSNSFLLYREVIPTTQAIATGSTTNSPPRYNERHNPLYTATSVRPNTKLVPGGLAKRTISLIGSNGAKYRVINYFYPGHVDSDNSGGGSGSNGGRGSRSRSTGVLGIPSEMAEFRDIYEMLTASKTGEDGGSGSIQPVAAAASAAAQRNPPRRLNSNRQELHEGALLDNQAIHMANERHGSAGGCPCGGLYGRTPFDYSYRFNDERIWTGEYIVLAPIRDLA